MRFRDFPATFTICAITALISALILITGHLPEAAVLAGFIPARVQTELLAPGTWAVPAWLTPFSTLFVHQGALQIFFNVLMLIVCGQKTEQAIGWPQFVVLYLIGALAGSAGYALVAPDAVWPLLGMGGALSAVIGAYSLLYGQPRNPAIGPLSARTVHVLWLAAAWAAISVLIAVMQVPPRGVSAIDVIAWSAGPPIAGFLAGLGVARPLFMWHWRKA